MKAIVQKKLGSPDMLQYTEVPMPDAGDGQVLVRVYAAGLNPCDWHFMRGEPYIVRLTAAGLRRPQNPILGSDIASEIFAMGGVDRFAVGDRVYGFIGSGGLAEYLAAPEGRIALMPMNLTFEEAAALPLAGMTALRSRWERG